jgi:hypothetical protein
MTRLIVLNPRTGLRIEVPLDIDESLLPKEPQTVELVKEGKRPGHYACTWHTAGEKR